MAKSYDYLFKILLIGDSGVGKTCILCRFANNEFNRSHISTIGIDFKMKTIVVEGKRIRIQMWDTAGQERYETITTQYYRRAHGIILVYDITRQETYNNIRKWLRYVDEHANNNVKRLLLANKCDAEDERRVWKDQGVRFAAEKNIKFYETSAQSNINIDEAFTEICRQILETMNESNQNGGMLSATGQAGSGAILLDTKQEVLPRSSCCYS